jgi:hypothetical protein
MSPRIFAVPFIEPIPPDRWNRSHFRDGLPKPHDPKRFPGFLRPLDEGEAVRPEFRDGDFFHKTQ